MSDEATRQILTEALIAKISRLEAELASRDEKILSMTEAAIRIIQSHHDEIQQANEMIELLKQSRANGDVLAELVEKDEHIRKSIETLRAYHLTWDIVAAAIQTLEQVLNDDI